MFYIQTKSTTLIIFLYFDKGGYFCMDFNHTDILSLLGLPSDKIVDVYEEKDANGAIVLHGTFNDERPRCKHCGHTNTWHKNYIYRIIKNNVLKMNNLYLVIKIPQRICPKCHKTFISELNFLGKRKTITTVVCMSILEEFKNPNKTITGIAKEYNVSPTFVMNIFENNLSVSRYKLPRVLCIDEFHFRVTKFNKYPCILLDGENHDITDVVYSRKYDFLFKYFSSISPSERQNVEFYVTDMHMPYRKIKKELFPKAIHIIDTFHIVKLFNDAITSLRIQTLKQINKTSYEFSFLKLHWNLFLMQRKKVQNHPIYHEKTCEHLDTYEMIDRCLSKNNNLREAYNLKEDFLKYEKNISFTEAEHFIDEFIQRSAFQDSDILTKLSETLKTRKLEIINGFCRNSLNINITNAIAERRNGDVKKTIRIAYGYHNFEHLRKRVLYVNHNKKKEY